MQELFASKYNFTIKGTTLQPACKDDIPALALLYDSVKIDKRNYKQRFDPKSKKNFSQTGGMFNALSETDIEEILNDNDSIILTANKDNITVALLWISLSDPALTGAGPTGLYFRDIIVKQKRIFSALIYTSVLVAEQLGYTNSLAEIYNVTGYNDGSEQDVGILNERSFNAALSAGGEFKTELPPKTVYADGIEYNIVPTVVAFEFENVKNILKKKIGGLV